MRGSTGMKLLVSGATLALSAGLLAGTTTTSASALGSASAAAPTAVTKANLKPLNNSPVTGTAKVTVDGRRLQVSVDATRLLKRVPHAQHIHFGEQARNECPTVRDDDNADHRLTATEGTPAYGPVKVSLTTRGDTSPKSILAVNRFPKARDRQIHYDRSMKTGSKTARGIRNGEAAVVIHGIDYNNNGKYDFSSGRSELDRALPAEATDVVSCGVLKVVDGGDGGGVPIP